MQHWDAFCRLYLKLQQEFLNTSVMVYDMSIFFFCSGVDHSILKGKTKHSVIMTSLIQNEINFLIIASMLIILHYFFLNTGMAIFCFVS